MHLQGHSRAAPYLHPPPAAKGMHHEKALPLAIESSLCLAGDEARRCYSRLGMTTMVDVVLLQGLLTVRRVPACAAVFAVLAV